MNPFVADPEWGWWIIFYFYLGGISAGSYFIATLIDMWGQDADRPLARLGYRIAFPLIVVCGLLLIVDLERPERFWHMMFQSEVVHAAKEEGWPLGGWGMMVQAPLVKWWSPMSIGAWALALFGAWSALSFLATFWSSSILNLVMGRNIAGLIFRVLGSGLGFFVASYTGVLLTATNQPLWSISEWIAPLFLTSAASTAIAVLLLLGRGVSAETRERLERADLWALGLELFLFLIFLASLGNLLSPALQTWQGWVLIAGTLSVGLLLPLGLHLALRDPSSGRVTLAALFALAGGFLLRFGIVTIGPALLDTLGKRSTEEMLAVLDSLHAPLISSWIGMALIALALLMACGIPMLLRRQWNLSAASTGMAVIVSCLMLACVLYYSLRPATAHAATLLAARVRISPEDDRERGGGVGASPFNRPDVFRMRTKLTQGESP